MNRRPLFAATTPLAHIGDVAKRSVKSLHSTGRVSRKRASAVAKQLHLELQSGSAVHTSGKRITRKTTASGRGAISFHIDAAKPARARKSPRSAAR